MQDVRLAVIANHKRLRKRGYSLEILKIPSGEKLSDKTGDNMDKRQSELLEFFYDSLFIALDRRAEQHRQVVMQSKSYIECKTQLQTLIENSDNEVNAKLLESQLSHIKKRLQPLQNHNVINLRNNEKIPEQQKLKRDFFVMKKLKKQEKSGIIRQEGILVNGDYFCEEKGCEHDETLRDSY